jgi:hypothetical protein
MARSSRNMLWLCGFYVIIVVCLDGVIHNFNCTSTLMWDKDVCQGYWEVNTFYSTLSFKRVCTSMCSKWSYLTWEQFHRLTQLNNIYNMKFRIFFWDVLPCKIIVNQRLRGTCCLHHQGSLMLEADVPLKRRSTIILHGSTSQKKILNFILAAVRTWNLTISIIVHCSWN